MDTRLDLAIHAIEEEEYSTARNLLKKLISEDDNNEDAWFWLSHAVPTDRERIIYLKQTLRINPNNTAANDELKNLKLEPRESKFTPSEVQPELNNASEFVSREHDNLEQKENEKRIEQQSEFVSREHDNLEQKENEKRIEQQSEFVSREHDNLEQKENEKRIEQQLENNIKSRDRINNWEQEAKSNGFEALLAFIGVVGFLGIVFFYWEELGYLVFAIPLVDIPILGARLGFFLFAIYAAYRGYQKYSTYRSLRDYIEKEKIKLTTNTLS